MRVDILHRQPIGGDDDVQITRAGIAQQPVEPRLQTSTVLYEQVRVGDGRDVLRRRLKRLGRCADRHDVLDADILAADTLHERVERRNGRRDLNLMVRRGVLRLASRQQRDSENELQSAF